MTSGLFCAGSELGQFRLASTAAQLDTERGVLHGRVLLGVDAPFGLPSGFVAAVAGPLAAMQPLNREHFSRPIKNPLADREADLIVRRGFQRTPPPGWRPLVSSFDALTSNGAHELAQRRIAHPGGVCTQPFDQDSARVAVVDAYPKLWSVATGRARDNRGLLAALNAALGAPSEDERDAFLCALATASYYVTVAGNRSYLA